MKTIPAPSTLNWLVPLVEELADAHEDTVRMATAPATAPEWEVHLDYLRALQRLARETIAHA
ncbi:MAG: hypothetical protein ACTHOE_08390 [Conexibacter sp.]